MTQNKMTFLRAKTLLLASALIISFVFIFTLAISVMHTGFVNAQSGTSDPCVAYSGADKTRCDTAYRACVNGLRQPATVANLATCATNAARTGEQFDRQAAIKVCNIKIDDRAKNTCLRQVNACQPQNSLTCLRNAVRLGASVYGMCRTAPDPQKCHAATKECDKLSARQADEIKECKQNAARTNNPNLSASEGLEGASAGGPISLNEDREINGQCGEGENAVQTSIDFGCTGKGNPIVDIAFAIVRFLSFGVGLVIAASIIYAGIQYSASSGNPENSQNAKNRIINSLVGLVFYLLIFAFIQFLVPGGLFN